MTVWNEIIYYGSLKKRRLGVLAHYNGDEGTTQLRIITPCCGALVEYAANLKVRCTDCHETYDGYTDNKHDVDPHYPASVHQWVSSWLGLERDEVVVKISS